MPRPGNIRRRVPLIVPGEDMTYDPLYQALTGTSPTISASSTRTPKVSGSPSLTGESLETGYEPMDPSLCHDNMATVNEQRGLNWQEEPTSLPVTPSMSQPQPRELGGSQSLDSVHIQQEYNRLLSMAMDRILTRGNLGVSLRPGPLSSTTPSQT